MHLKLILASATLALATAGVAQAGPASKVALPNQPVPYTMLDAYLKATPKARAAMLADASSPGAQTDAAANVGAAGASSTSETSADAAPADPAPAAPKAPGASAGDSAASSGSMPAGPVNPPAATPPPTNSGSEPNATGSAAPDKP